jgi:hypothetical protein
MRSVRALALVLSLSTGCGSDSLGTADVGSQEVDAGTSKGVHDAGRALPEDAGPVVRFSEIYAELFPAKTNARCNFCHSMPASDKSNGMLGMGDSKDAAYAALMAKTSASTHCTGMPLLTPGDPEASLFFLKFSEPAPCGARMPLGGAQLTAAQLARIRSWIERGAKND